MPYLVDIQNGSMVEIELKISKGGIAHQFRVKSTGILYSRITLNQARHVIVENEMDGWEKILASINMEIKKAESKMKALQMVKSDVLLTKSKEKSKKTSKNIKKHKKTADFQEKKLEFSDGLLSNIPCVPHDILMFGLKNGYSVDGDGNVVGVNASGMGLSEIPSEIWGFDRLEYLDLSCNNIKEFNIAKGQADRLKFLSLDGNRIKELNESSLFALDNLHYLLLGGNELESIPEAIYALINLKGLYLWDNSLEVELFSQILKNMPSLVELDVTGNGAEHHLLDDIGSGVDILFERYGVNVIAQ